MTGAPTLSRDDYTIGWVCALPVERASATSMLDEVHRNLPVPPTDHNTYTLGRIGNHNIVVACLPSGEYGIASAAIVAMQLLSSFPSIHFGLMVGIGGGVPNKDADIRLGDIVVSKPTKGYGGVIQYDYGKAVHGGLERTGTLNQPPRLILTALAALEANHLAGKGQISELLSEMTSKLGQNASNFMLQDQEDRLYLADYQHITHITTCELCDRSKIIPRPLRKIPEPVVHYGLIASGNQVVKDSHFRDHLGHELGVYCVEMEAAGLMNDFPCLVIRGICDYADSHKNKEWQGYAAAVAAAYAKELLLIIPTIQNTSLASGRCILLSIV
jgi:nucleoside phosphorylase